MGQHRWRPTSPPATQVWADGSAGTDWSSDVRFWRCAKCGAQVMTRDPAPLKGRRRLRILGVTATCEDEAVKSLHSE